MENWHIFGLINEKFKIVTWELQFGRACILMLIKVFTKGKKGGGIA